MNDSELELDTTEAPPAPSGPRINPSMESAQIPIRDPATIGQSRAPTEVPPPESLKDPYIGTTVDSRYYVEAQLGEGGMGVVYLCRHTIIDKKVAMKVLRADMSRNEEVTERFLNEARSASSIENAHIIDISDFGQLPDGATYFVMEFLVGTPLAELADERKALDPNRVAHIAVQLAEGLGAAHDVGIIHRDLKPDNIFLIKQGAEEEFVKILDFGIAKAKSSTSKLTQAGQVFGTPHYMSPEQAAGRAVDNRSDIYSLGVILYELSTGTLPFDAEHFMAILTKHMYEEPHPPSEVEGIPHELPAELQRVILTCMKKKPEDRYQSMHEVSQELHRIFAGAVPITARHMRRFVDTAGGFAARLSDGVSVGNSPESSDGRVTAKGPFTTFTETPHLRLYLGIGVAAALAAGLGVWVATPSAKSRIQPEVPQVVMAPPEPPLPPPAAAPAAAPAHKSISISVTPPEARIFAGDKEIGSRLVALEYSGQSFPVSARLKGYQSRTVSVDGTKTDIAIELQRIKKPSPARPRVRRAPQPRSRPKAQPKKTLGDGELVNPWD